MKDTNELATYEPSSIKQKARFLNKIPQDKEAQNKLGNELMSWVSTQDTYILADFPISKSMAPSRFYRIAETNEYFAGCLDFARAMISSRMQHAWQEKKLEREYVLKLLPLYDDAYRDLALQKHKILEEARHQPAVINVHMDSIPALRSSDG